jgi:hypothetical protein
MRRRHERRHERGNGREQCQFEDARRLHGVSIRAVT